MHCKQEIIQFSLICLIWKHGFICEEESGQLVTIFLCHQELMLCFMYCYCSCYFLFTSLERERKNCDFVFLFSSDKCRWYTLTPTIKAVLIVTWISLSFSPLLCVCVWFLLVSTRLHLSNQWLFLTFLCSGIKLRVRLFGNALALTFISERRQNNQSQGLLRWQLRSVVHVWVKQEKCQSQWQLPPITQSRTWGQHPLGHQQQNHANITLLFTFLSPPMLSSPMQPADGYVQLRGLSGPHVRHVAAEGQPWAREST